MLAAIGLYGVMAFGVRQRRQEIATRMALGARRADVVGVVVWQGLKLALLGMAIGGAVALVASELLEAILFGVAARDPGVFGVIALVLAAVALLASWLPARRAARLDPALVLREK